MDRPVYIPLSIIGDIVFKDPETLQLLASEDGPGAMLVLDHHFAPLVQAYKQLAENYQTLLAKTYFVCDYSGKIAAGTLAKQFFDGMVCYTDLGEKIVQVAQAIDLFQKTLGCFGTDF